MGKSGKIAPIRKDYSGAFSTIDSSLAKAGYFRAPGTSRTFLPFKEISGKYRTGLDPEAPYLNRLSVEEREAEIKRIKEDKARLEEALGMKGKGILDPTSDFWNFAASRAKLEAAYGSDIKVSPVKLGTSEEYFNFGPYDTMKEITWNWLRVHPDIAPSLEAWQRGEVSSDIQYYVVNDEAENLQIYNRKKEINKAIVAFEQLSPSRKKQIGRLMGLPITESTTEEVVYNLVDSQLKETEFKQGKNKGLAPIRLFTDLLKMDADRIKVKDLVKQAINYNVYRIGQGGKITEGQLTIAASEEELVDHLLDDKNQVDLLALEKKLNIKKID